MPGSGYPELELLVKRKSWDIGASGSGLRRTLFQGLIIITPLSAVITHFCPTIPPQYGRNGPVKDGSYQVMTVLTGEAGFSRLIQVVFRDVNLSVFFDSCLSSEQDPWSPVTDCYRPTVMRSTQCGGVIMGFLVAPHDRDW
jgi:hypothetical protein